MCARSWDSKTMDKPRGFTLTEVLVSLTVFSFVVLAAMECFTTARSHFLDMKNKHQTSQAILSAMDKIRADVLPSGKGLIIPIRLGLVKGIRCGEGILHIQISDQEFQSISPLVSGQTRISFHKTSFLKKKRKLCIYDQNKGEVKDILSVDSKSCVISSPLSYSYDKDEACIALLRELMFYLDEKKDVFRRKVNSSPAQPLLEDASLFECSYDETRYLVRVTICLKDKKESKHEMFLFSKNSALAGCISP
ncbi:MAG: prepilin-type N-terminal cleavage/methylation domain-containing protein [Candidatus Aminicenantes bacterium]|nr:prepilin-type N-terminal cleavage/methylation domain-containing protein [Candidatus Aminicenantes bacterium]